MCMHRLTMVTQMRSIRFVCYWICSTLFIFNVNCNTPQQLAWRLDLSHSISNWWMDPGTLPSLSHWPVLHFSVRAMTSGITERSLRSIHPFYLANHQHYRVPNIFLRPTLFLFAQSGLQWVWCSFLLLHLLHLPSPADLELPRISPPPRLSKRFHRLYKRFHLMLFCVSPRLAVSFNECIFVCMHVCMYLLNAMYLLSLNGNKYISCSSIQNKLNSFKEVI